MGCGASSPEIAEQNARNKEVEKELRKLNEESQGEVKVLLLGSGASGKSTIAKQMKLLYLDGFTEKEASIFKEIICFNIIKNMKALVVQAEKFGYALKQENKASADEIKNMTIQLSDVELTSERGNNISSLWKDPAIQQTLDRQSEFQLDDSAPYFFDNLSRIVGQGYRPTNEDILNVRAKTTGIVETEFIMKGLHFRMVDVGGQRNERKKWIHCFQDVTAIIFVVAISEYDLKLEEDLVTNRMHESLKLFNDVVNNKWFESTNVILFLNKKDLFAVKVKKVPLTICFPEYDRKPNDYDDGAAFILEKFLTTNKSGKSMREIYQYQTCATDTNNIKVVFSAVSDIFLKHTTDEMGVGV